MHPEIIRKMNEIIGRIKVIDREISAYGSMYEKKNVARSRTPDIMKKFGELGKIIAEKGADAQTNKYYTELTNEITRVLNVKDPMEFKFPI